MVDWTALISELQSLGMTQQQMASNCRCGQSTISELAKGVTKDPRHSIGQALLRLLEAKRREAAEKGIAPPAPAAGASAAAVGM